MDLPNYLDIDRTIESMEGGDSIKHFDDYLELLQDYARDEKEEGILALAIDKGPGALSAKQRFVLSMLMEKYPLTSCDVCGVAMVDESPNDSDASHFCEFHEQHLKDLIDKD
ncbi:hypothetical protein BWI93_27270 [Siphonobacter sp. BAB-5385]|uniref:hypothetical protein n=1 Tax=Siphonobacter sp. BAB-5385 TaxID=1864822 RepID=UPI000B9E161A|nr:hypothetical protein [Siphonobacter sp. BAB-5385]OZI05090.1 hypothetical protein BWI93_27270 [Siphonobacter sp. BAB-5385]